MLGWLETGRQRGTALDRRFGLDLHRGTTRPALLRLLVCTSRLGDAAVWLPLALLLPLFAALGGLSRVALGVHYPSDVLAGALIGLCSAAAPLWLAAPVG